MDWTTIYSESGDEELLPPTEALRQSRLSRLVSKVYIQHHKNLSMGSGSLRSLLAVRLDDDIIADGGEEEGGGGGDSVLSASSPSSYYTLSSLYFLTINYILGVGCLGIPYAFYRSGVVLGLALVTIVTVLSYVTVMWVAETGARYEMIRSSPRNTTLNKHDTFIAMSKHNDYNGINDKNNTKSNNKQTGIKTTTSPSFLYADLNPTDSPSRPIKQPPRNCIRGDDNNNNPLKSSHLNHNHQRPQPPPPLSPSLPHDNNNSNTTSNNNNMTDEYEVINLISFFLPPIHTHLYQTSLMALMYTGLLAYSQVFVGSLSSLLPSLSIGLGTILFACLVVPLSCMELDEQISVQFVLSLVRFLAIFVMIVGSVMGLIVGGGMGGGGEEEADVVVGGGAGREWLWNPNGFGVAFSTALFSQLFQHSVPGLVRPLKVEKKKKVPTVFAYSLATTYSFYLLLGITAAAYFGPSVNPSVNLNFTDLFSNNNKLLKLATNLIVIFPALDTLSVFPLIANTLGSNLLALCENDTYLTSCLIAYSKMMLQCCNDNHRARRSRRREMKRHDREQLSQKIITLSFRLVACVPPLVLSTIVTDLSISMQLAGVSGLYVAFVAPALLQRRSCRMVMEERGGVVEVEGGGGGGVSGDVYTGWYSPMEYTTWVLVFAMLSLMVVMYLMWVDIRNK